MINVRLDKFRQLLGTALILWCVILLGGCSKFFLKEEPKKRSDIEFFTHTVTQNGETLELISKWYTGSVKNWRIIQGADLTLNANKIKIGDQIRIPEKLVTNCNPLPPSIVARYLERLSAGRPKSSKIEANLPNPNGTPGYSSNDSNSPTREATDAANEAELDKLIQGLIE